MKILRLLPLLLAALPVAPVAADDVLGDLVFANGDLLEGLSGFAYEDGHLVMEGEEVIPEAAKVPIGRIFELRLPGSGLPKVAANHVARLQLTNGDALHGQLKGLDGDHVTIATTFAGEMRIKRSMSGSLRIRRSDSAVYVGPDSLQNWSTNLNGNAWSLRNNQLFADASGSIAREIKLPERCRISFKLAWKNDLKWRLLLLSNKGDTNRPENCYEIVMQRRYVYARKRWRVAKSGGSRNIGRPASIDLFARKSEVHLEFFIDRKAGEIILYVDGQPAQSWIDESPETGAFGDWFHFISEGQPLRISEMMASPWGGTLPDKEDQESQLEDIDLIVTEVGITDQGGLVVKTGDDEIEVPRDHGLSIGLSEEGSPDYEEPIRRSNDVRAWLHGGGQLTFQLRSVDGDTLSGYSQAYGDITCALEALSHIEFNIYNEDRHSKQSTIKWDAVE